MTYYSHIQCHLLCICTWITFYPLVKRTLCKRTLFFPCLGSSLFIVPHSFPSSSSPLLSSFLLSFKFFWVLGDPFLSLYFSFLFIGKTFIVFYIVLNYRRFTFLNIRYVCFFFLHFFVAFSFIFVFVVIRQAFVFAWLFSIDFMCCHQHVVQMCHVFFFWSFTKGMHLNFHLNCVI